MWCESNEKIFTDSVGGLLLYDSTSGSCVCVFLLITRSAQVTILFVACEFNEKIFTTSTWELPLYDPTSGSCVCVFILVTRPAQVTSLLMACEFNEKNKRNGLGSSTF